MSDRPAVTARGWSGHVLTAFGAAVLLLWLVAPGALPVVLLGSAPTKPAAAAGFLLLGLAVTAPPASWRRHGALAGVATIALLVLGAAVLGRDNVFHQTLYLRSWDGVATDGTGSIAAGTAVGLLAAAVGVGLGDRAGRRWGACAVAVAALVFGDGYVALVGHLYGASNLYRLQSATDMAVSTGLALLVSAFAVAASHPSSPLHRVWDLGGTAGVLVRRMLPLALLLPAVIGWLSLTGVRHGLYTYPFGVALMVLAFAGGTVMAVLVAAKAADRVDRQRHRTAQALATLNEELADRVQVAVADSQAGRERLSLLLDSSPVGIFETGPDGSRRYVNQRWREITGMVEGGLGDEWTASLHPDDRERVIADWTEAVTAGREYTGRYRYVRPDGTVTWVETTTRALRDQADSITGWLGSVTDVTRQMLAQESLEESERRYRSVVSALVEGVMIQDAAGRVTAVNAAACTVLGVSPTRLVHHPASAAFGVPVHEDGRAFAPEDVPSARAMAVGGAVRDVTMGVDRPDGSRIWLRTNAVPLGDETSPAGVVTTFVDVTAQLESETALRRSEERFRLAMAHAPIGKAIVSLDGRFQSVNGALTDLLGYAPSELEGMTFQQISHPHDLKADLDQIAQLLDGAISHYSMEKRFFRKDGQMVWVLLAVSLVRDEQGRPEYFISQLQDVTEAREAQQQLVHRALHDPLTGLANRELIHEHLERAIARADRRGESVAVLFCDLDHFKNVNDVHGHQAGDAVLLAVADRLRRSVRPTDTVGRLGGDEFVVVVEDVPDPELVVELARRVHEELNQPVVVGGTTMPVGASIGVARGSGRDARALLRDADEAMYRAKAAGRGRFELFDSRFGSGVESPAGRAEDLVG